MSVPYHELVEYAEFPDRCPPEQVARMARELLHRRDEAAAEAKHRAHLEYLHSGLRGSP